MEHMNQLRGIKLTRREREILDYLTIGFCTRKIADLLSISENTVYNHRKSVLKKKGFSNCRALVAAI